jgi:hypothetical protein
MAAQVGVFLFYLWRIDTDKPNFNFDIVTNSSEGVTVIKTDDFKLAGHRSSFPLGLP